MAESYEQLKDQYEKLKDWSDSLAEELIATKADRDHWAKLAKDLYEYYYLGSGSSQCVNNYINHTHSIAQ